MSKKKGPISNNTSGWIITLVLITVVIYFKSLFFDFSPMDEDWLIIRNEPFIKDWHNVLVSFFDSVQGLYYRPLLIVSFITDYHLGHLNPFIYHFTNLLIHVLCAVTLFRLLLEIGNDKKSSFFFAALFSIHPMALHAVAWIPGRNDLLLCLFTVLSCYYLIKYLNEKKVIHSIFHFLFFMMSLFSKENAVFLFPVFLFIFFTFATPEKKKLFVFIGIWFLLIALWYFLLSGIIKTSIGTGPDILHTLKGFFAGFLIFIGKTIMPIKQSVSPNVGNSTVFIGIIVLALFSYTWFKLGVKNKKIAILGLVIYFILLAVPVWFGATSPIGEHLEHRAYSSMIGFMIFASQLNINFNLKLVRNIAAGLLIVFATKTFVRMNIYKTGLSYLNEAVADCPKNYFFHARKGNLLADKGEFSAALSCYNDAILLYAKKPQVYNDRANTYVALRKKNEAIADYTKALELSGNNPQILVYRCTAYKIFGDIENAMVDLVELRKCCANFIPPNLDSEITTEWNAFQFSELNKLISATPNSAILYVNRAKFFIDRRMGNEALVDLKRACELEPKNEIYRGYYNELSSSLPH